MIAATPPDFLAMMTSREPLQEQVAAPASAVLIFCDTWITAVMPVKSIGPTCLTTPLSVIAKPPLLMTLSAFTNTVGSATPPVRVARVASAAPVPVELKKVPSLDKNELLDARGRNEFTPGRG